MKKLLAIIALVATTLTMTGCTSNFGSSSFYNSQRYYVVQFASLSGNNLADGQVIYVGVAGNSFSANNGVDNYYEAAIPISGKIVAWSFYLDAVASNTGISTETGTLVLRRNTGSTGSDLDTLTSSVLFTATSGVGSFYSGTLSRTVSAGDRLQFKLTCPTWATNPTSSFATNGYLVIQY